MRAAVRCLGPVPPLLLPATSSACATSAARYVGEEDATLDNLCVLLSQSDAFIYAPNAAGVAMALMQATLKLRFPSGVAGTAKAQAELKRTPSSEPLAAEGLQGVQDI